ncbi:unnamed protein product, partial [Brachionus calyciflorus]
MSPNISRILKNNDVLKKRLSDCLENLKSEQDSIKDLKKELENDYLSMDLLVRIKKLSNKYLDKKIYVNDLIKDVNLYLPKLEQFEKNEEHEQKMKILKAQLEEEEYQRMVRNVDVGFAKKNTNSVGLFTDFKTTSGQLTSIFNVIVVIGASFFFGYKATELTMEQPDPAK